MASDPFEKLGEKLEPFVLSEVFRRAPLRNPFAQTEKLKPVVVIEEAPKDDPTHRIRAFLITGVFCGARVRAVRISGQRIEQGTWFFEKDGVIRKARDGEKGEYLLERVTPEAVYFQHSSGLTVERSTRLRGQLAKTDPTAPSPTPSASPGNDPGPQPEETPPASPTPAAPSAAPSPASSR